MYSIRRRLNYSIIASLILVLLAAAAYLYVRVSAEVEAVFDTALYDKAQALISLTELDEEGLEFDFAEDGVMREFVDGDDLQYYQLWELGTGPLLKSPSLGENELPRQGREPGQYGFADLLLADGRRGRLIEIGFMPRVEDEEDEEEEFYEIPPAKPVTLVFARERESLDATLTAIGATIGGVVIGISLIAALLIWRLVGSGLAPLSTLARQVGEIDESRLDTRLTHRGRQSIEIAPIANQLNHLLERLQSAFERERRFSANVAHELRTPLSELRTLSEVGPMLPEDREQVNAFFDDVGEISAQMEKVVVTLLELARSEAGLLRSDPEDIELAAFCDDIWKHAINGQGSDKLLLKHIPADLVINTDREKLGMILSNLFSNAVSYSPDKAEIRIAAEIRNDYVVIEVSNASIDLKPEDIVHMKDRFWRKQAARGDSGHSGLGLTLVEALANIMQLDIRLELDQRQTFMVTISGLQPAPQSPSA